jgi:hypothetical protein
MVFPRVPGSKTVGAQWTTCSGAADTEAWPGPLGTGDTAASLAASNVANATHVVIEGFIIYTQKNANLLTITDGAGTAIDAFAVNNATFAGVFIPFGIEGIEIKGPFGFEQSVADGIIQIFYRIIGETS